MNTYGVICFVVGVASLGVLAIRRGNGKAMGWFDYGLIFLGLASIIAGLALFFIYAQLT